MCAESVFSRLAIRDNNDDFTVLFFDLGVPQNNFKGSHGIVGVVSSGVIEVGDCGGGVVGGGGGDLRGGGGDSGGDFGGDFGGGNCGRYGRNGQYIGV